MPRRRVVCTMLFVQLACVRFSGWVDAGDGSTCLVSSPLFISFRYSFSCCACDQAPRYYNGNCGKQVTYGRLSFLELMHFHDVDSMTGGLTPMEKRQQATACVFMCSVNVVLNLISFCDSQVRQCVQVCRFTHSSFLVSCLSVSVESISAVYMRRMRAGFHSKLSVWLGSRRHRRMFGSSG